jgi:hypothetical protein
MDSMFVWILLFSGAAITLLAVFLVASEKELKKKRLEIDELLAKLSVTPGAESLAGSESSIAANNQELDQLRAKNQQLERELAAVSSRLESGTSASEELQLAERNVEIAQANAQWLKNNNDELKTEIEELKSRLVAGEAHSGDFDRSGYAGVERQQELEQEVTDLRALLAEARSQSRAVDGTDIPAMESSHRQEKNDLESRIADLEREISAISAARADESAALRNQLADAEQIQQSLRHNQYGLEQELNQLQTRVIDAEERSRQMSELHEPLSKLLIKHSALEERQREYHEALASFAQLITQASNKSAHQTTTGAAFNEAHQQPINNFGYESQPTKVSPEQIIAAAESSAETPKRRVGAIPLLIALVLGGTVMVALWSMQGSDRQTVSIAKQEIASNPPQVRVAPAEPVPSAPIAAEPVEQVKPAPQEVKPAASEKPRQAKLIDAVKAQQASTGTYEITQSTRVYAAPSELSEQMGDIAPGVRVNVVNSKNGWLEIHSKHGRPPGYIRKEGTRVLAQN